MTVYKRPNSPHFHFDFQLRGHRFCGTTGCTTLEDAKKFEASERSKAKKKVADAMQRSIARLQPPKRVLAPKKPQVGVYLLLQKGKVIYIGSSLRMPSRVADHQSNGRPFDEWFYIATEAKERGRLEAILIKAMHPTQNKVHRTSATSEHQR
jgi:hypothetical protein